jgi:hypothetical protein
MEAQRLAVKAEKNNPRSRPKRYGGNSKRTLKRRRTYREDLEKKGYLSVFGFIEHVKEKKAKLAAATDIEQVLEESVPEELGTEDPGPKHMGQVRCRRVLMCRN